MLAMADMLAMEAMEDTEDILSARGLLMLKPRLRLDTLEDTVVMPAMEDMPAMEVMLAMEDMEDTEDITLARGLLMLRLDILEAMAVMPAMEDMVDTEDTEDSTVDELLKVCVMIQIIKRQ